MRSWETKSQLLFFLFRHRLLFLAEQTLGAPIQVLVRLQGLLFIIVGENRPSGHEQPINRDRIVPSPLLP